MKLIESNLFKFFDESSKSDGRFVDTWLCDSEADVDLSATTDSAFGSMILVISTKNVYVKNTKNKWQKLGSDEVLNETF